MFLEDKRGMIKGKRVRIRSREVRSSYWPNSSPICGYLNKPRRF